MFFRRKKEAIEVRRRIVLTKQITNSVITYAKSWHPNEGILILQGKKEKNVIKITGLIIPPFSTHPSRSNKPSLEDLNHFFGLVSLIICYPYEVQDMAAFDRNGNDIDLETE